jgi:succinyl-diaminopimelate desuccinylase
LAKSDASFVTSPTSTIIASVTDVNDRLTARIQDAVDRAELVDITQRLVQVDSTNPPGREHNAAMILEGIAQEAGLRVELVTVAEGRSNVTICLPGDGSDPRKLLYCGHLDTVVIGDSPWDHPPFGAAVVEGEIWGRGSVDMKGGIAAMLGALATLNRMGIRRPGDIVLATVVGEEVDCIGSRHLLATGGMADVAWLVVGEPTDLELVTAHKGCLRLRVTACGVAAHASQPELGRNAVLAMTRLLPLLARVDVGGPRHELLSPATSAPTVISGGSAINIVPDRCWVDFDIRTVPGQMDDDLVERFTTAIRHFNDAEPDIDVHIDVSCERSAVQTPPEAPLVDAFRNVMASVSGRMCSPRGVSFFTDASILQPPTAVPTVLFGPGDTALMHQTNERVRIDDLVLAARVLALAPLALW